jgi:DNA-binding beta-propeller fold protein YncE
VSLLDPATAQVTVLAGALDQPGHTDATGAAARFRNPYDVARLPDGRIAVADYGNHRIRAITLGGVVTTLAGSGVLGAGDGPAATATFGYPQGLAADASGRLYISDTESFTIRTLDAGTVSTLTGGTAGWLDGTLAEAQFYGLEGIALDPTGGALWVADGSRGEALPYNRIRRVALP